MSSTLSTMRCISLEISGKCQLSCGHCCTDSGPQAPAGVMTGADWGRVLDDVAALGIPAVQFIGGEPTLSRHLVPLLDQAHDLSLAAEVYSNLTHVRPSLWARFERPGMSLATSWYSDTPEEHERITGGRGSYARTLANIQRALDLGIRLRVGLVQVHEDQRVDQAVAQLGALGVEHVRVDRVRKVGRAAGGAEPSTAELCGRCYTTTATIGPDGDLYGCLMSRGLPSPGNVRVTPLAELLAAPEWAEAAARVPLRATNCGPQDSDDSACQPNQDSDCDPAFAGGGDGLLGHGRVLPFVGAGA